MPFGLVNAPATFQRAMSVALRGCEQFTAIYLDDILIFSDCLEEHYEHLRQVFECLQRQRYHVRLTKCSFAQTEVPFLGHTLTQDGIRASDKRHTAFEAFRPPFVSSKQVKSFLGLTMWYKAFVPHLATLAAPLFSLTSTTRGFKWTPEATQAVEGIKRAMESLPTLGRFKAELDTRVTTDASMVGTGAVLEQRHEEYWKLIAFWSRKLRDPEIRYSATDLEWLAVVEAVSTIWRHFLEDRPFILRSDHCALARKLAKSSHDPPITPRQARWIGRLMPFPLTFQHIPGSENIVADALSRYPTPALYHVTIVSPPMFQCLHLVRTAAATDPEYDRAVRALEQGQEVQIRGWRARGATGRPELWHGLVVLPDQRIFVPKDEAIRTLLISSAHDPIVCGHFGLEKTLEKLTRHWWWHGIGADAQEYVKTCARC